MFFQRFIHMVMLPVLFLVFFSSTTLANDELTDEQLHAVMGIITNFILSDVPKGVLKKTGQTKSYDANGNEVTDGSIKDDGYYQTGVTPSYTRDDATNIVTDHITGLEWQDDAEAKTISVNWADAQSYCSALSLDGGGWRLPTVQELQSIVVDRAYNPSIDTMAFVNYTTSDYDCWSSTTVAYDPFPAWLVNFDYGNTYDYSKSPTLYVRCVR